MLTAKRMRNPNWTDDEIYRLLELLQEKEVLKYMRDNRTRYVFHYISSKLTEEGREKTPLQCKVKLKNLKFHWKTVAERVPFLETADLEDETHMMMLIEECEKNGISSFNVRHVRMLKRFLDGLASMRSGLSHIPPDRTVPLTFGIGRPEEAGNPSDGGEIVENGIKTESYVIDINDESISEDYSLNSQANDESLTEEQDDSEEYNPLSIVEVTTVGCDEDVEEDGDERVRLNTYMATKEESDSDPHVEKNDSRSLRALLSEGFPENKGKISTRSGNLVIIPKPNRDQESCSQSSGKLQNGKNAITLGRVQMEMAEKFASLQRESSQRAVKFEQDQMRMEQSFLENWRLSQKSQMERWRAEQLSLMDKWRREQREHEERMLNIFTNFITETTKMLTGRDES